MENQGHSVATRSFWRLAFERPALTPLRIHLLFVIGFSWGIGGIGSPAHANPDGPTQASPLAAIDDNRSASRNVTKIAAGTIIDAGTIAGWTDRVLVARPRVAAGDVDGVSALIKGHAELLAFVVLARVEWRTTDAASGAQAADPSPGEAAGPARTAVLADVGVGLATTVDGKLQVASGPEVVVPRGATVPPVGIGRPAPLGFIGSRVLASAEQSLDDMRVVARRTTLVIYDSPAVIAIDGRNRSCYVRSIIWVEPKTGKLHHAIWAMQRGQRELWIPAMEQGVYLPVPFEEDRVLRVESDRFTFGLPAATAFGMAKLPPGLPFSLQGSLAELACQSEYDEASLADLAGALVGALRRTAQSTGDQSGVSR
jgi:hypothetical protein